MDGFRSRHLLQKKNSYSEEWTFPRFLLSTFSVDQRDVAITSSANDLFAVWEFGGAQPYYYFRHYDDVPLVPQNFVGSVYYTQFNSYPKLDWSLNNEPDVRVNDDGFIVYRSLNGGAFLPCTTLSGQTSSFIDFSVPYAGGGPSTARYKIKARDLNGYESDWTNIVSIAYGNVYKIGSDAVQKDIPKDFSLSQNYPNPFNPTTTINYSIKESGLVCLKVYDVLGTEVASLVNETKEPGNYSVTFNAANLPSGMYVYILSTGNFVDTKKLILLK